MRLDPRRARPQRPTRTGGGAHRGRRPAHRGGTQRHVRARVRHGLRPRAGLRTAVPRPRVLERALRETGADAVWVGWGFVAEDPAFARAVRRGIGVTFIGPSRRGDAHSSATRSAPSCIAEEVGVPVAPWSRGAVDTLEEATAAAARDRLPADAQGHRRRRRARHPHGRARTQTSTTPTSAPATRPSAPSATGIVFLEQLVTGARHVEVQVIADGHGTAWALGVRDCSVQRRNQKVIEESASPRARRRAGATSSRPPPSGSPLAVGYVGAGTVEFLYHPGERTLRLPRGQHPPPGRAPDHRGRPPASTWSRLQIHVAAGGRLEGEPPGELGHAVEARLNAEDPDRDFAPAPGRIALPRAARGPGHPGRHRGRPRATRSPPTSTR